MKIMSGVPTKDISPDILLLSSVPLDMDDARFAKDSQAPG
jgi:hypothetical protein